MKTPKTCIVNTPNGILDVAGQVCGRPWKLYNPYTGEHVNRIDVYLPHRREDMEPVDWAYAELLLSHKRDGVIVHFSRRDFNTAPILHK